MALKSLALIVAALVLAPILVIVTRVGADSGGVLAHLADTVLAEYAVNTAWLCVGVSVLTLVFGVSGAWLVTMCRFPGVGLFRWAMLLPLAAPTYLTAYALTDLLQFSVLPPVRSLGGAIVILSLGLYPYIYLAARTAFLEQSVCALEVSRMLGLGAWGSFRRVALPLARPSLIAGLSLVLMETVAEFGAVDYCAVDTFATGVYRTWHVYGLTPAAQLATILLGFVLLLIVLELLARRAAKYHHATSQYRALPAWPLTGVRAGLAIVCCSIPVLFGFLLPAGLFVKMTVASGDAKAIETFAMLGRNTVIVAVLASAIVALSALVVGYARRMHPSLAVRAACRVAGIGYAVPGGVIAIGVLIVVGAIDRGWPGQLLGGTILAMILGYQTRFLAVSLNFVGAGLARIRPSMDDAARMLGAAPGRVLRSVHVPLMRGSLFAALLLVFVDVIKELPATLILRPFNFDTLAVRVYHLASDERLAEASTGALAIIVVGLVPVVVLSRLMERARPGAPL